MSSKGARSGDHVTHVSKKQRLLTKVSVSDDKENTGGNSGNSSGASSATPRMWERFLAKGEDRGCITLVDALPFIVKIALEGDKFVKSGYS